MNCRKSSGIASEDAGVVLRTTVSSWPREELISPFLGRRIKHAENEVVAEGVKE